MGGGGGGGGRGRCGEIRGESPRLVAGLIARDVVDGGGRRDGGGPVFDDVSQREVRREVACVWSPLGLGTGSGRVLAARVRRGVAQAERAGALSHRVRPVRLDPTFTAVEV